MVDNVDQQLNIINCAAEETKRLISRSSVVSVTLNVNRAWHLFRFSVTLSTTLQFKLYKHLLPEVRYRTLSASSCSLNSVKSLCKRMFVPESQTQWKKITEVLHIEQCIQDHTSFWSSKLGLISRKRLTETSIRQKRYCWGGSYSTLTTNKEGVLINQNSQGA